MYKETYMQAKLFIEKIERSMAKDYTKVADTMRFDDFFLHHNFINILEELLGTEVSDRTIVEMDVEKYYRKLLVKGYPEDIAIHMAEDASSGNVTTAVGSYKVFKDKPCKNFILSGNLIKYLSKMRGDYPSDIFPENFHGYFEPNVNMILANENPVKCAYCTVKKDELGNRLITMTCIHKPVGGFYSFSNFAATLYKDKTIKESMFETIKSKENGDESVLFSSNYDDDEGFSQFENSALAVFINAIVYVSHPNEDFIEEFNIFSPKLKKREGQLKEATEETFHKVGFHLDAEFIKAIFERETQVRWHIRNQACGPMHRDRKKIVIAPHIRKTTKRIEEK